MKTPPNDPGMPRPRMLTPVPGSTGEPEDETLATDARATQVQALLAERLAEIVDESDGRDVEIVALFSQEITLASEWITTMEEQRDAAVARMRDAGIPMTRIARYAGVSDSYLARRLFRRGVARKVVRGTSLAVAGVALTGATVASLFAFGASLDIDDLPLSVPDVDLVLALP